MDIKTFRDLWYDDRLDEVLSEADPSWRHGCYMHEVYRNPENNTYWSVNYQRSGDGEYNGLREGDFDLQQVEPYEEVVTVTKYRVI